MYIWYIKIVHNQLKKCICVSFQHLPLPQNRLNVHHFNILGNNTNQKLELFYKFILFIDTFKTCMKYACP